MGSWRRGIVESNESTVPRCLQVVESNESAVPRRPQVVESNESAGPRRPRVVGSSEIPLRRVPGNCKVQELVDYLEPCLERPRAIRAGRRQL